MTAASYVHAAVIDTAAEQGTSWIASLPTAFSSASEHCIALCRLRF
jgi:hypothetical protein